MVSCCTLVSSACRGVHVSGSGHILSRGVFLLPNSSHRHEAEDQSAQDEGGSGAARCVWGTLEPTSSAPVCLISLFLCCHSFFNSIFTVVLLVIIFPLVFFLPCVFSFFYFVHYLSIYLSIHSFSMGLYFLAFFICSSVLSFFWIMIFLLCCHSFLQIFYILFFFPFRIMKIHKCLLCVDEMTALQVLTLHR